MAEFTESKKLKVVFISHFQSSRIRRWCGAEFSKFKTIQEEFLCGVIVFQKPLQRNHFSLFYHILRYFFYSNSFGVIASKKYYISVSSNMWRTHPTYLFFQLSESNMKVTRIKEMISYNLLIIRQILLFSTLGNE